HSENFPTASLLIRRDLRPAVAAIYAFAREADDIADEGDAAPDARLKRLAAWETLLERTAAGDAPEHPVFVALADAIRRHRLPVAPLHDLLVAFRMDCSVHAYASEAELRFYCRHSANPVGRLMLALHGVDDAAAVRESDAACTALQWINFWQDLGLDLSRGRCYLPEEWLRQRNLSSEVLLAAEACPDAGALREVIAFALARTRTLLDEAANLPERLPFRLRMQVGITLAAACRLCDAIARNPEPIRRRPALGRADWIAAFLVGASTAMLPRPAARGAAAP
ncbi:MAG: squalene synthase HpnC, partial [Mariprofundaceae bacterium]